MIYSCYTLAGLEPIRGIAPDEYESVLTSNGEHLTTGVIYRMPVTDSGNENAPWLSFIRQEPCSSPDAGSIVSLDPRVWRLCMSASPIVLLDPCGLSGNVLVYCPPSAPNLLVNVQDSLTVVSTDDTGMPVVSKTTRAQLMLTALALRGACPVPPLVSAGAIAKAPATGKRRTQKEAQAAKARRHGTKK